MTLSLISRLSDDQPWCEEEKLIVDNTHKTFLIELEMLLSSRVRQPELENINLVNASILNYGIDESFSKINELAARRTVLEERLKNAITRYEPRLTSVSLFSSLTEKEISFTLQAFYCGDPFMLELRWDDCTGRFYFNE